MSNVEALPLSHRSLTEFEALVAAGPTALDAIPGAVYLCDQEGWLVRHNSEAAALWGRTPHGKERFCGSHLLFTTDGAPLPHEKCPMAAAVMDGTETRNAEVLIQRPDGSRITALVNIRPLRDHHGRVQGAINCFQDITTQKAMEDEVRHKNTELEDFFENSAVGLHIVSGDGVIVRANKAELELLGYTADEYVGRHISEFHADAPVIHDILDRLSCGRKLDRYPARLRAKDGSIKHVLITSNSRFKDGKFVNTRCFTTDITQLQLSESARRESEDRLAATYEAATIGIAEADEHGRLLRVNDALCQILGLSREKMLTMRFFDYTHPDDRDQDAASYARQVAGEISSYSIRKKAVGPGGKTLFLDVYSSTVRNADGGFRYGVRVIQDVTEAKLLEDRIRESERHMRELLEALPAAVYTTDAKGRITFFNKAAVEMAGRTPEVGDEWCVTWKLYTTDGAYLPHDQCPMAVALKEDRPIRGVEAVAERPDGTRVPFMPYPTPLHDADGKLVGAINMLVDISHRKEAENRQKSLIDELNHRVKNTLATVQSLASQTIRHSDSLDEFKSKFEARVFALARVHDLLSRRYWTEAPLEPLAREVLAPLMEGAAVKIQGPPIQLMPRAALSLAMAFNELATNAAKYGALSDRAGSLSLTWRGFEAEGDAMLEIIWKEYSARMISGPIRRGFGTRLMERSVENDLNGEFDLAFEADGLRCRMAIPVGAR